MRDSVKDKKYFDSFIREEMKRLTIYTKDSQNKSLSPVFRKIALKNVIHIRQSVLIAGYSRGDDLRSLKNDFIQLIFPWKETFDSNNYIRNLQIVSLAILFNVDSEISKKITEEFSNTTVDDLLLNYFINKLNNKEPNITNINLSNDDRYFLLQKCILDNHSIYLVKEFLENKWYSEDCGCYELHKLKDKFYYGYWSFESGALVKILNMDDSELKTSRFYPYDLVHYFDS